MLLPQNTHFSGLSPWISTPCLIQFILSGLSLYSSKILLTETTLDKSFFVFSKNNVKLKFLSKLTKSIFCGLFMFFSRIVFWLVQHSFLTQLQPSHHLVMVK